MSYNIAIIGATGLVGVEIIKLLEKSKVPIKKLFLFASNKSLNKEVLFKNKKLIIKSLNLDLLKNIDFVFFAAGSKISKELIPKIDKKKTYIIDLSSYFRLKEDVPLIIPEINGHLLNKNTKVVASPNCTTTIMLMALHDLHKKYKIKRIISSTYQAASGGGKKLIAKLLRDTKKTLSSSATTSYGLNLFLHESPLNSDLYSEEEEKMIKETKKILNSKDIKLSATCVRVPVIRAHSMSLNVEFESNFELNDIHSTLKQAKGVEVLEGTTFASPNDASFKEKVFISRVRKDISLKNAVDMWVVADQLLKGAALNAIQILEYLIFLIEKS